MAMPFGELKVDQVFTVFEKACADTDFRLVRLDKHPKAGIIDNRHRVDIGTSRFVIADLTNDNKGAYWEGGFAEGLGKPVFCSYEKSFFKEKPSHFDSNHSYTVLWDVHNLEAAGEELKNAIRATLPGEAKMSDD